MAAGNPPLVGTASPRGEKYGGSNFGRPVHVVHEPHAYLKDVLERLPATRTTELDALLPENWQPKSAWTRETKKAAPRRAAWFLSNFQKCPEIKRSSWPSRPLPSCVVPSLPLAR